MATELTANLRRAEAIKSSITTIIEDYPGQDPAMGSSQPPGPALVAAAADADPVTLLVLAWLSARRSENTRAAYARDIGITPQRRPGRAPSWLAWCQQQEVHPVTGVTGLHVARYARQLDTAGLSPASAARKLAAISSWYAWLARRGHITASPAAGIARPRPGPRTPAAPALTQDQALALIHAADTAPGPQRARTAALIAVLLFTGARLSEVTGADVADLGTSGGRRVLWVTRAGGRRQDLPLPGPAASRIDAYLASRARPGRRPGAVRHPDRQAAIRRRRAADPAPPRHPGRPARRPGSPPGTAHDPALLHHAVSSGRGVPRPPQQHAACRLMHHPAIRARPGIQIHHYGPEAGLTAAPAALNTPPGRPGRAYHPRTSARSAGRRMSPGRATLPPCRKASRTTSMRLWKAEASSPGQSWHLNCYPLIHSPVHPQLHSS